MLPYYHRTPEERPGARLGHGFAVFALLLAWIVLVGLLIGGPRLAARPAPVATVAHCFDTEWEMFRPCDVVKREVGV